MSTLAKLDPRVRRARADRRETVRSLARVIVALKSQTPPSLERIALAGLTHDVLTSMTRNPRTSGARKSQLFANLIKTLEEPTNASSTAQPSAS